jgi:hypothetical protein
MTSFVETSGLGVAEMRKLMEPMVARRLTVVAGPIFMFLNHGLDPRVVVVAMPYSEQAIRLISQLSTPAYHTPLEFVQRERYDPSDHLGFDRQNALGR